MSCGLPPSNMSRLLEASCAHSYFWAAETVPECNIRVGSGEYKVVTWTVLQGSAGNVMVLISGLKICCGVSMKTPGETIRLPSCLFPSTLIFSSTWKTKTNHLTGETKKRSSSILTDGLRTTTLLAKSSMLTLMRPARTLYL